MTILTSQLHEHITALAQARQLEFLGVASLGREEHVACFSDWLQRGMHGQMAYLADHAEVRADSSKIMPEAKAALMFALPYYFTDKHSSAAAQPRLACYARLKDYHVVLRTALHEIAQQLTGLIGKPMQGFRIMVDTAPLFERALAVRTGRGFIGRNSCYILPGLGSYVLLAEIVTTAAIENFAPISKDQHSTCVQCSRCQSHCPTGALATPYTVDARRCLSYWTIEHRGTIPEELWPYFKTFYFGCDLCQEVCPCNQSVTAGRGAAGLLKLKTSPDLLTVATMDQKKYVEIFGGTPLTRAKIHGLQRNALIALPPTAHPGLTEALEYIDASAHPVLLATKQQILRQAKG